MSIILVARLTISYISAILAGFSIINWLKSADIKRPIETLINSYFIGIGLCSLLYFYFIIFLGKPNYYPILEVTISVLLFIKSRSSTQMCSIWKGIIKKVINKNNILILLILLLIGTYITNYIRVFPNGAYDAFYMWNFKAKFLSCQEPGATWKELFSYNFADSHLDYPLLLPCLLAREYTFYGRINNYSPSGTAFIFTFSCFILLFLYTKHLRNQFYSLIGISLLATSEEFIFYGVWQCADIILALYILNSMYELLTWNISEQKKSFPSLLPLYAALAAWTKNEGILFLVILYAFIIANLWKNKEIIFKKSLIALPILFSLIIQYTLIPESNDLIKDLTKRTFSFFNYDTYYYIYSFTLAFLKKNLWIIAFLVTFMAGFINLKFWRKNQIILIPLVAYIFYCIAYFITPHDVYWHIKNSFARIMQHYLPSLMLLFLCFFSHKRKNLKNQIK